MNRITSIILILIISYSTQGNSTFKKEKDYAFNLKKSSVSIKEKSKRFPQIPGKDKNIFSDFKSFTFGINTTTGDYAVSDTTVKIIASGTEIVGNKDDGFFIFKEIKGDFEISLRAHSLSPGNLQTIAGFMARQDLSDNAKHISFCIFPDNQKRNNKYRGCVMQRRLKKGDNAETIYPNQQTDVNKLDVIFPKTWIKLTRIGNHFSAFISHDNLNWFLYSTYEQKMPKKLLVGLYASSNNSDGYTIFEISDFQLSTNKQ